VSINGSPYAHFRRALDTGNLALIRTAAAELPQINLDDALRICRVIREREPESLTGPLVAGWRAMRRSAERLWRDWRWRWRRWTSCARPRIWRTKCWSGCDG
jgi:hypothetical protein